MAVPTTSLQTTTLRLIRRRMADNIFKANPTAAFFLMKNRVKTAPGGRFIAEPLMYATNSTVQAYRGYDRLNVAPTEELTEAQYNWRQAAVSISISGEEELINDGPEAVFSLIRAKIKVAELSEKQFLDEKMHASVASKNTLVDILGLDEFCDDTTSWSTVGAIDSNVETWWRNQLGPAGDGSAVLPSSGTGVGIITDPVHITAATQFDVFIELMNRMYHNCSKNITTPDLILTSQGGFEYYERAAHDKRRITSNEMANLGFDNVMFKGATMMYNENIKTGGTGADTHVMYFLNTEFLSFTLHRKRNFVISEFVSPWDQDARVAQILFAGNMTCNNRRFQGVTWFDLV